MRRPVLILAIGQVIAAVLLVLVAYSGVQRGEEINALRGELAQARTDLARATAAAAAAEQRADRLQTRVDALSDALLRMGVDPSAIPQPSNDTPRPRPSDAAPSPAARPSPPPARRASPKPQPTRSASSSPSPCTVRNPITGTCLVPPDQRGRP